LSIAVVNTARLFSGADACMDAVRYMEMIL
jgi:hypothetical protein